MNATPATYFKLVHAKFFFGGAKTLLDCPPAEGDLQQRPERRALTTDHLIGKKVFDFASQHIATDQQGVLPGWQFGLLALAPEHGVFDFPDFRAAIGVLDSPALPFLITKGR